MPTEAPHSDGLQALFFSVVTHPVAVTMMFLAALNFGWVSYQRLPIELMPDISYPTITVRTGFDGAAPQEVESQVSRPVEESLATLDGLVSIQSRSRAGSSDVMLGFDWGTDMSAAAQSIRENLQTTFLPLETDRPLILRYDPSLDPFMRLALSVDSEAEVDLGEKRLDGEVALFALRELAEDDIKRKLETLPGVAAVRVLGGLEREIRIEVREDWLAARSVTMQQVEGALASENINVAGGSIIEGDVEYLIRTLNEYSTLDELKQIRIRRTDGVQIPITDVATLSPGHRDRQVISRLNGGEAVELEVFKEADANIVQVAERVGEVLEGNGAPVQFGGVAGLSDDLPAGVVLTVLDNQARFISDAVTNLRDTAVLGGFFAVAVLFLFLRDFRSTAIIGISIPLSVVVGFAPLYLQGISLNLMSLGGLALGVGMLVDNAVVVLESIQRWREEGLERIEASVRGVSDVATAVVASTLTTVAVFFPISFVEGVAGELFGDLSIAVVSSLLASLVVALFAVPTLAALELDLTGVLTGGGLMSSAARGAQENRVMYVARMFKVVWLRSWAAAREDWRASMVWNRQRRVRFLLLPYQLTRFLIHLLMAVAGASTAVLAGLAGRVFVRIQRWILGPAGWLALRAADRFQRVYQPLADSYENRLSGALSRPFGVLGGALLMFLVSLGLMGSLGTELIPELHQGRFTAELALPVGTPLERTAYIVSEAERIVESHPRVAVVYSTVGVDRTADARSDEGEHTARLRVQLTPDGDMATLENQVMEDLRQALAEIEKLKVKMVRPSLFSYQTPVEVVLFGFDMDLLRLSGDQVVEALSQSTGLRDVKTSLVSGNPEVRILYDRERLSRLGLDASSVASQVRNKVQGVEATKINQGEKRVALRVQLVERDRGTLEDLRSLNVNPNLVPAIPLSAVADFEEAVGPSEIRRVDQQRAVVVSANLSGFDLGNAADDIRSNLDAVPLDPEIRWTVAGQSKEMQESLSSLRFALLLAVFLVYVIMASTFENVVHPFVILFSVPLALVGAVLGLMLSGSPISVVVLIGVIVLSGVVVNNAIVLVDTVNRLRSDGLELDAAIEKAGKLRLRPILITTATTVLGLMPLALGFGAGSEMQGPLAVTVIGGLLSSTLLTLVVIPVVYRVMNRRTPVADPVVAGSGATT